MTVKRLSLLIGVAVAAAVSLTALTHAEPAVNVTATILHRAAFGPFKVKTRPSSPLDLEMKAKTPVEFVVRKHDYAVGGHTGWHRHPGPVFIKVTEGELTAYEYDDPTCTGHVYKAGDTFVDNGEDGHILRNESGAPAQDISIIMAAPGGAFRENLPPRTDCGF
ncbi:MAG: hypothetical protein QOF76_1420 [Solirubrobacteraceae bacterium]|jgi:quercetin dioxygenase-like cupin family protein|nr:hypothetical protein [Solirubrobacteraceae bacterium]